MKQNKRVTFSKKIDIKTFKAINNYNFINGRGESLRINRRLRRLERYMRKIDLLTKNEYLDFINKPKKHIRGDLINFISRRRKWINRKEYLMIVIN